MEIKQLVAQYKFDKSIYDNFIPEFNTEFTNYEIVDEYLDTEDIMTTSTETMMLFNSDSVPDEYGVLTTEYEIENISTFNAENITTRSIYSDNLPTKMRFGSIDGSGGINSLLEVLCLNTSELTAMDGMFSNCSNLTSLDLNGCDTSKVITMNSMFQGCQSLTSLDASDFDTGNVTDMGYMFFQCKKLTSVDTNNWDVSNVNDIQFMFKFCNLLIELDLSNWNITNQLSNAFQSFCACQNLKRLNISNWDLSNARISSMLDLNNNLDSIIMNNSNYNSVNKVIEQLPTRTVESPGTLNVSGIDDIGQVNVDTAESKFWNIINEELEEPKQLVAQYKFTNSYDVIPIFNEGFSYVIEDIVDGETTTRIIKSAKFPTAISFENSTQLLEVYYLETSNMTSAYNLFYNCSNLIYVDLNHSDFSNIETIERMFTSCTNLVTIDGLNDLNISKVHNMGGIFSDCRKLKEINVSDWDVSKVTNFGAVFRRCYEITSLDINNWDTSSAVLMSGVFTNCTKLTSIDISNWNMDNVTTVNQMFYGCSKLTSVNLYKHLNNGVDTLYLFGNCSSLNSVEVYNSNYNTVNMIISALSTKTNTAPGILNISGIDDISQVNTTTAQAKYWDLVNEVPEKINFLRIGDTIINNVYIGDSQVLKIYLGTVLVYETSFK